MSASLRQHGFVGLWRWRSLLIQRLGCGSRRSICFQCRGKPFQRSPHILFLSSVKSEKRFLTSHNHKLFPHGTRGNGTLATTLAQPHELQTAAPLPRGAIEQYKRWVSIGRLREDPHQRGIVQALQNLQNELKSYTPPEVIHPFLLPPQRTSLIDALLRRGSAPQPTTELPEHVPKGLYLYGDVGSGKTMLMDMFYETLPPNILSKTRIHFHNFMQDVHKRLHALRFKHGNEFDAMPFVGAQIAEQGSVLCFDEFQCTDVADAMILRRLLESLMSHGVVFVCTSNRHPNDLYKNGIQRESFLPCIALLNNCLQVINLDSETDYRKLPRPSSSVYHYPLDKAAEAHARKWFTYLGDSNDPPHPASHSVWGREVKVPAASGKAAMFKFKDLCEKPLGAADYLELTNRYNSFIVTDVPNMDHKTRDLARRFITFIDAVYESRAKLVLTLASSPSKLFVDQDTPSLNEIEGGELDSAYRALMDDLQINMKMLKNSSIFTGDEERFAFARALSRLSEMEGVGWVGRSDS